MPFSRNNGAIDGCLGGGDWFESYLSIPNAFLIRAIAPVIRSAINAPLMPTVRLGSNCVIVGCVSTWRETCATRRTQLPDGSCPRHA